jgi:thiamine biosynthesis protein ThiS
VEITLNGKSYELEEEITLQELIYALDVDPKTIAVGYNEDVIPKDKLEQQMVSEGDRIDIVHFVAGG